MAGQGRAGEGRAGQHRAGQGRAGQGKQNRKGRHLQMLSHWASFLILWPTNSMSVHHCLSFGPPGSIKKPLSDCSSLLLLYSIYMTYMLPGVSSAYTEQRLEVSQSTSSLHACMHE